MKAYSLLSVILINILLLGCRPKHEIPRKIALEDFFKNPEIAYYRISPDGKHYSYAAPWESRLNVFVHEVGNDSAMQITFEKDRSIYYYFWANDNRILYIKDEGGNEDEKLYGVDIDGSNLKCLTCIEGVKTEIIDELVDIPDKIIIGLNNRNPQVFDPYLLNIETGKMLLLATNPGNITSWFTDHDGKLRAAIAITDGVNSTLLYRASEDEEFKEVLTTSWRDSFYPMFFTFDNSKLYASSNLGRDKMEIVIFDPETGEEVETIFKSSEADVEELAFSRKYSKLTYAAYTTDRQQYHFFDRPTKLMFGNLTSQIPDYEYAIANNNKNEDKFIIRTYSDRSRGAYYLYDAETSKTTKLADLSPWIKEDEMAEMKSVQYTSRDGLTINGYLTLPKGRRLKDLPTVMLIHGGPWARDTWGFDPEVQFLANRGFGVLQVNYRGSTGYGKEFWLKSVKQWGRAMQDDISDGVQWLIEQGIANPERIAIYGGSYGGYATLAGLTLTPDLYACGIDYVGVSNMFTFMNTIPAYWKPQLEMMYELVGNPIEDSLLLAEVSPALHADKIMVPLFIAQGANDPRVNKAESDQMVEALKARGIEVEYMVKDNEGHGFYNEENRFDFYRSMEKFLATYIGDSLNVAH